VTANLKADQIAQDLDLYRDLVQAVSTRTTVQTKLGQYNDGNLSESLLEDLSEELHDALSGGAENKILLQAAVFPRSDRTDQGGQAISNATGEGAIGTVVLPGTYQNGSRILLGDHNGSGYPAQLYPNFTWSDETQNVTHILYCGRRLYYDTTLMLGPLYLDAESATAALISMTVAINNNTSRT
jgi:hypothetical protein